VRWRITNADVFAVWLERCDEDDQDRVFAAIEMLEEQGPALSRPLVDRIEGSRHQDMKELRTGDIRILFAFDPTRTGILLIGGSKRNKWKKFYNEAIPIADALYAEHLDALRKESRR
jgi:hypothetical protein